MLSLIFAVEIDSVAQRKQVFGNDVKEKELIVVSVSVTEGPAERSVRRAELGTNTSRIQTPGTTLR